MANAFDSDSNCVALWRFESSTFLLDSIGSNHLTDHNSVDIYTLQSKEGGSCARLSSGLAQYLNIADASLDAEFPLKSGDTTKTASFSFWFKAEYLPGYGDIDNLITKWQWGTAPSFGLRLTNSALSLGWGYGPSSQDTSWAIATVSAGVWYHVGLAIDGKNKTALVRLYNANTDSAATYEHSFSNEIYVGSSPFAVGAETTQYYFSGMVDELAVFKDVKTAADFDLIRAGTYAAGLSLIEGEIEISGLADVDGRFLHGLGMTFESPMSGAAYIASGPTLSLLAFITPPAFSSRFSASTWLTLDSASIPTITADATLVRLTYLNATMPTITAEARLDLKTRLSAPIPSIALEAYLAGGVNATLTPPTLSATLAANPLVEVDVLVPGIAFSSALSQTAPLSASGTVPKPTGSAELSRSALLSVDADIDRPSLVAAITQTAALTLDAALSPPAFASYLTGETRVAADCEVDQITIESTLKQTAGLYLSASMPRPVLSSSTSREADFTLNSTITRPTFSAAIHQYAALSLSAALSSPILIATVAGKTLVSADCILRSPTLTSVLRQTAALSLSADIPTPSLSSEATGERRVTVDASTPHPTLSAEFKQSAAVLLRRAISVPLCSATLVRSGVVSSAITVPLPTLSSSFKRTAIIAESGVITGPSLSSTSHQTSTPSADIDMPSITLESILLTNPDYLGTYVMKFKRTEWSAV